MFELSYEPWAVGGTEVAETKRITLDAGHYLNHVESTYRPWPAQARVGIGIRANPGAGCVGQQGGHPARVGADPEQGGGERLDGLRRRPGLA